MEKGGDTLSYYVFLQEYLKVSNSIVDKGELDYSDIN